MQNEQKQDWADHRVGRAEVAAAYRLFLGREAEDEAVLDEKVGFTRRDLIRAFIGSSEFSSKMGFGSTGGLVWAEDVLTCRIEPKAAELLALTTPETQAQLGVDSQSSLLDLIVALLDAGVLGSDVAWQGGESSSGLSWLPSAWQEVRERAQIVRASAFFDAGYYSTSLNLPEDVADLASHYLLVGERAGLRPGPRFDPLLYRAAQPSLTYSTDNALLHYLSTATDEAGGLDWMLAGDDLRREVELLRSSALFDPAYYRAQLAGAGLDCGDPALHYRLHGEKLALKPSPHFDAKVYAALYPDLSGWGANLLLHYERHGRQEGRQHRSVLDEVELPIDRLDPAKDTVLLLFHEAGVSGAPILGWNVARELANRYNVVAVMRSGGSLEGPIADVAVPVGPLPASAAGHDGQLRLLADALVQTYKPLYAIANSVETRKIASALRAAGAPIVALVHEFASTNPQPGAAGQSFFSDCASVVFPAELVRASSSDRHPEVAILDTHVLPQGRSEVPNLGATHVSRLAQLARPLGRGLTRTELGGVFAASAQGARPFTVIGLGRVELRKGVDLFIAAGTAWRAKHPHVPFQMIWIGHWSDTDAGFHTFLKEQVERSGIGDRLLFFDPTDDLASIYAGADALFLSSRLDPLPNISIDAASFGLPVVCFDGASGTAEILKARPGLAKLVSPYADTGAVADTLAWLERDASAYAAVSREIRAVADQTFDMARYVQSIDQLGLRAVSKVARAEREAELIEASGLFEPSFYADPAETGPLDARGLIKTYLDSTYGVNFAQPPLKGAGVRRPVPGFHPFIYGSHAPGFPPDGSRDPLAHYIESGMPPGPWMARTVRLKPGPPTASANRSRASGLVGRLIGRGQTRTRAALHGHFYYTDDIQEFIEALAANTSIIDLFLTTGSEASRGVLMQACGAYAGGNCTIDIVENVGRDVAPFLEVLDRRIGADYDIVGHIHGKKSVRTLTSGEHIGSQWRRFLWRSLLGPNYPAADAILTAFAKDRRLGLVFPQEQFTVGWDANFELAQALASRLGIRRPLPAHMNFPVGTMFWARTDALRPLRQLGLGAADFPPEPLADDGTMLHALERLFPLICERAGFDYAMTYSPSLRR